MIWNIFVFGGILFWGFALAELALITTCLHYRKGGWATMSFGVFLVALWLFGDFNIFSWCWDNPEWAGYGTLGYVVGACGWGFGKWALYQRGHSYRYLELRNKFFEINKIEGESIPSHLKVAWLNWYRDNKAPEDWESEIDYNPRASDHKTTILDWMMFWPISLVWTVIDDAVIKFFKHMYYMMYGWLEVIRKYYWGRFETDMPTAADEIAHREYQKMKQEQR